MITPFENLGENGGRDIGEIDRCICLSSEIWLLVVISFQASETCGEEWDDKKRIGLGGEGTRSW
jgi:hypothetical protein